MNKTIAFVIIAVVLVVTVIAGFMVLRSRDGSQSTFTENQPGPSPALRSVVTLEEFGDYQCPPCAQLHPTLKDLKQQLGPKLNFVFRNLPLSSIHKNALPAAQAAEAARMQNSFWQMHDLLYENQSVWADAKDPKPHFRKFANDLGLDTTRFEADMEGDQVRFRLEADRDAAVRLGIEGTPTILIDGRQLRPEATNPDGVRKGIEVTMARQSKAFLRPRPPGLCTVNKTDRFQAPQEVVLKHCKLTVATASLKLTNLKFWLTF